VAAQDGGVIDRPGLADFLRRRREQLSPADVGLPPGVRRRTPGLRRDEVAQLAGMSTDYYTRLEQGRGPHPSESMVAAVARALRFDLDERDHLFHLSGLTPPERRSGGHLRPGLVALADHLVDVPVVISSDIGELLWQNQMADAVLGSCDEPAGRARNMTWLWFQGYGRRDRVPEDDWEFHSVAHVNDLRATYARRNSDADVTQLVDDLLASSEEFRRLWERHDVGRRRRTEKRFIHPEVGLVQLTCEVLLTPDTDIRLSVFFPTAGTDARDKLDLLRVIGSQQLTTPG
jgi:transcriptional regulator with XRE-family HTH domain